MILGKNKDSKDTEDFNSLKKIITLLSDKIIDKSTLFHYILTEIQNYISINKIIFFLFDKKNIAQNTNNESIFSVCICKFDNNKIVNCNLENKRYFSRLSKRLFNINEARINNNIDTHEESSDEITKELENVFNNTISDFSFFSLKENQDKKVVVAFLKTNDSEKHNVEDFVKDKNGHYSISNYYEYLNSVILFLKMVFDFELLQLTDTKSENIQKDSDSGFFVEMTGESQNFKKMVSLAQRVAKTDTTVLITGESGTGKELIAKYIYLHSDRINEPYITLNCAAIPSDLLENELFGHVKGSFTDAVDDYLGKFGQANKGTLFLDEIGEMSFHLQSKLLRVLQYKVYEPIGSMKSYKSDVRIIAATNKDLSVEIKKNNFREDLFYRLNVVPIEVPPLRNRKNDIEILANYFLKVYNIKYNKTIKGFTRKLLTLMTNYNWPGNVRELENFIQRVVVLAGSVVDNSSKEYIDENDFEILDKNNSTKLVSMESDLKGAVNNFKKEFIEKILINNDWNQTRTAKELKIQRTYLSRLIKELNISKL